MPIEPKKTKGVFQKYEGGNWYIQYARNGRRVRQMIGKSKKVAEQALYKIQTQIAENKFLDVKRDQKVKFKDFEQTYMEMHSKPNKRSWLSSDVNGFKALRPVLGEFHLFEITPLMIENYKMERIKKVKPSTVNRELALLRNVFNKAIAWGVLSDNPMKQVKLFKVNDQRLRYLEDGERKALLDFASPALWRILVVLFNTGMRKGELQHLKWNDVDFKNDVITIPLSKSGKARHIPLNEEAKRAIISVPKHPGSSYIFAGKDGEPFNFRKAFMTACTKAKIKNFRIHDCRHDFASRLAMSGVDLNTIRELLGHADLKMTLRYSHLSKDHKARAVALLSNQSAPKMPPDQFSEPDEKYGEVVSSLNKIG